MNIFFIKYGIGTIFDIGGFMATIRDVAKLAGVSVSTVSRVLNGNDYVNRETEVKVRAAMNKLNYIPSVLARGLANKKTNAIALVLPDITNLFYPELARAVGITTQKYGYTLVLVNSDSHEINRDEQYMNILKNRYVDGIIFASYAPSHAEILEFRKINVPIVAIDRAADSQELPAIRVDQYHGAVMAIEHLLSVGCKNIAHIGGPHFISASVDRLQGCIDALGKANVLNPAYIVKGDYTIESGMGKTADLIQKHPEIDGIFAANDLMAVGALKTLIRLGKQVPDEVALIGFDDISLTSSIEPELSTIAQPIYEVGSLAVHQLMKQMSHHTNSTNDSKMLKTTLIKRSSTSRTLDLH